MPLTRRAAPADEPKVTTPATTSPATPATAPAPVSSRLRWVMIFTFDPCLETQHRLPGTGHRVDRANRAGKREAVRRHEVAANPFRRQLPRLLTDSCRGN